MTGQYPGRSTRIRDSVLARGIKGPTPSGEYAFWCPFCGERGCKEDEHLKGTLRIAGTAKVRPAPDEPREEIELSPEQGVFHCWRCGVHGVTDLSWILDLDGVALPSSVTETEEAMPPEGFEVLDPSRIEHARAVRYLQSGRKLDVLDLAIAAGAGVCRTGRYGGRVVIPHVENGAWRGFVGRCYLGRDLRYLTPRKMPRREMLWGIEGVDRSRPVWVVEGVFDALPLWPRAVATYGTGITKEQLDLIAGNFERVVICLDADAWKKARLLAATLRMRGVTTAWVRLPAGQDPGDIGWEVRKHVQSG